MCLTRIDARGDARDFQPHASGHVALLLQAACVRRRMSAFTNTALRRTHAPTNPPPHTTTATSLMVKGLGKVQGA